MPKINQTQFAILGHLSLRPLSGYGIKKAIAQSTQHFWSESYGNIYPALQKLLRSKLIKVVPNKNASSKKPQTQYGLTPAGMEHLVAWLEQPNLNAVRRDELLLKIFFGKHVSKKYLLASLTTETQALTQEISMLKQLKLTLPKQHAKNAHLPYWLMTINCGLKELTARLPWCDESIAFLKT